MPGPTLRPFRSRDFTILWGGALVSNVGTWMETAALGTLIARSTGRATDVAVAAAAGFLPSAVLSPVGGALADRFDRKRFLTVTLLAETVLAAVLALVVGFGERGTVVLSAIVFLESCVATLAQPNRQAVMPLLVAPEDLPAAVALGSASWNGGRVFGPALAAAVTVVGPAWAFGINAASFMVLFVAWLFIRLPPHARATGPQPGMVRLIREGFAAVRTQEQCRLAIILITVLGATAGPFIGLIAIMARGVHHGGGGITGLFISAQGFGAIIGALSTTRAAQRFGRGRSMLMYFCTLPVALLAYAVAPSPGWAAAALVVVGGAYMATLSGISATLQLAAAPAVRARVLATFSVALGAGYVAALLLNGVVADHVGVRQVTVAQAVATAAGLAGLAVWMPGWWRRVEVEVGVMPEAVGSGARS